MPISLTWDDELEHGETHDINCERVRAMRALLRQHGGFQSTDELKALLRRRPPCTCNGIETSSHNERLTK